MNQKIITVDAFTDKPFSGNPGAVCLLDSPMPEDMMQNIAREMNLSETAFLYPEGDARYHLRWFTPTVEVEMCGHDTLATAHVLFTDGHLAPEATARFRTLSGELTARRDGDWIELNFPATPAAASDTTKGLSEALGAEPGYVGMSRFDMLVELDSEQTVRNLTPDIAAIGKLPARGVIVTAAATMEGYDFVSRYFAPAIGIAEDPVTGSAHCVLAPYWSEKLNKPQMVGYQASARGGTVKMTVDGDRIRLAGRAVTMMRGEMSL
ncbi:MAG: PhzF family phenazine biosynthesis protein [Candidatus Zixiibacteriota bacterium]|nr:MAG: PhzF family phenazine biosynthesis protein [candidate division Zixibacteria bacterium]